MAANEFSFADGWEAKLGLDPPKDSDVPFWWLPSDWRIAYRPTEGTGKKPSKVCVSPKGLVLSSKQEIIERAVERAKTEAAKTQAAIVDAVTVEAEKESRTKSKGDLHTEKIWTYEEVGDLDKGALTEKPAHWPDLVRPDPAANLRKGHWLPEGWFYAVKTTAIGNEVKCYVNPDGRVFYNKADVEKSGAILRKEEWKPLEWPTWLPHDWCISRKIRSMGLPNTIYVRPDFTRFQWHKIGVETYLRGEAGGEGGKLNVDPSALPSAKRRKIDAPAMTEDEIESSDFISVPGKLTESGYDLYPLQEGRWVILPEDVDAVVLSKVRDSMKQLGWTCTAESDRCDTYAATENEAGQVKLFARCGRMLVSDNVAEAVALRAGRLYMDLLGTIE